MISPILTKLINLSFSSGIFPQALKVAKVIPIYKGKDKEDPNNYRPISITSVFSKIIEKIMKDRIDKYLMRASILNQNQYGFRTNSNTTYAMMDSLSKVYKALDNRKFSCAVFLDMTKAFDMVNHELLLTKLFNIGIRGIVNDWFRSYLTNREQFVTIGKHMSKNIINNSGVPQGSVLGPILYNLYINDFKYYFNNDNVKFYADDTVYVDSDKNLSHLNCRMNVNLDKINHYFQSNELVINYSKTNYILFKTKLNSNKDYNFHLNMGEREISETHNYKYLGLVIDKELNWKIHINSNIGKLKKYIFMFYKLRQFINSKMLHDIFNAYINPAIIYAIDIYGTKPSIEMKRLQNLVNKIKQLTCINDSHLDTIRVHSYDLERYIKFQHCKTIHKVIYDTKTPFNIKNIYLGRLRIHNKCTRKKNSIFVEQINTSKFKHSFVHQSILNWNKLPAELQDCINYKSFIKKLKLYT